MKRIFIAMICTLLASLTAYAGDCIDGRATYFATCEVGQERLYLQGACAKPYQVESTYCSPINSVPHCIDVRAADFAPCAERKTRIYVQGKCDQFYQIEHTYCANR